MGFVVECVRYRRPRVEEDGVIASRISPRRGDHHSGTARNQTERLPLQTSCASEIFIQFYIDVLIIAHSKTHFFNLTILHFSFKHPTFQTPSFRLKWWLKKHCIVFTQRNPGRFHTLHVFLESLNRSLIPYWSKNLFLNYRNKWMFKFMSFGPLEYFIKFCRACANASKILLMKSNCTVMWF